MTLSIEKLEKLLKNNGFVPLMYFTLDGYCMYVQIMSISNTCILMLYIPSKYVFKIPLGEYIYCLKSFNLDEQNTVLYDVSETKMKESCSNTDLYTNNISGCSIETHLENNYNNPVENENDINQDFKIINSIVRQIRRLRYCVQHIKYKIVMFYKNYLYVVHRNNSIECFQIQNYKCVPLRKMLVSADLELFYEKHKVLSDEVTQIRENILKVIKNNQLGNIRAMYKITKDKYDIIFYYNKCINKIKTYDDLILKFESLIQRLIKKEDDINMNLNVNMNIGTNLQRDIETAHFKSKIESEIQILTQYKKKITNTLTEIIEKQIDIILNFDQITFDTAMLIDTITTNFKHIIDMCK